MKQNIILLIIVTTGTFSCKHDSRPTLATAGKETVNTVRKYEYADSMGKRLVIYNSSPRGGAYTDPTGKKYPYAVFYSEITNETVDPVEIKLEPPLDSFEFPLSSGVNMEIIIPSDTMTQDKVSLTDYGLPIKSLFDTGINRSNPLTKTIHPKETTAFYMVLRSDKGVEGSLRTALSLRGQHLFYKISAYKSVPGHPLMGEKEINVGSISLKNLTLRE